MKRITPLPLGGRDQGGGAVCPGVPGVGRVAENRPCPFGAA